MGMQPDFFSSNRSKLCGVLNGGLIVLSAYTRMQQSNDTASSFQQESNFWYLSGIEEPDWWIIIDGLEQKTWLVSPEIDEVRLTFDGRLSTAEVMRISGVQKVIGNDEAMSLLRTLSKKHSVVHFVEQPAYADTLGFSLNPALKHNAQMLERIFAKVQNCNKELAALRAKKTPEELQAIKGAVNSTVRAFKEVHAKLNTFSYEYQIEAEFSYAFRKHGLEGHAYEPIVAAGANACTLHYIKNNAKISTGQLVLMDIGARSSGYAADISRTYIKGQPTKRQKEVHSAVEQAHHQIIGMLEPNLSVELYQTEVIKIMEAVLVSLNLMNVGDENKLRRYFPHAISHGLGIDVHDSLGAPRTFQPGMVLTVEPGIYIPEEGIGVRIEDDIVITEKGHHNLSAALSTGL